MGHGRAMVFGLTLLTGVMVLVAVAGAVSLSSCGIAMPWVRQSWCPVEPARIATPRGGQLVDLAAEGRALEQQLNSLRERATLAVACPEPPSPPPPVREARVEPPPPVAPQPRQEEPPPPVAQRQCISAVSESHEAKVVAIFDATPSMRIPQELTPGEREKVRYIESEVARSRLPDGTIPTVNQEAAAVYRRLMGAHGRMSRLQVAKRDLIASMRTLASKPVTLVVMKNCGPGEIQRNFPASLIGGALGGVEPPETGGGTDIAGALRTAASEFAGPDAEGAILLVTDGNQSCEGNACATARDIHRSLPKVAVHVIDVAGHLSANCLVGNGGKLWQAGPGADLSALMAQARQEFDRERCDVVQPPARAAR